MMSKGFEVNIPVIKGVGPSVYGVLEAAWLLPALLIGAKNRIWEIPCPPRMGQVTKVWLQFGYMIYNGVQYELTPEGERLMAVIPLLDYEFSMMNQQLDENYVTDPNKYVQLRTALAAYTEHFTQPLLDFVAHSSSPGAANILDFGGGDGIYLEAALDARPMAMGYLFDKAPGDRLKDDPRVEIMTEQFANITACFPLGNLDTIIVSEVLHVMGGEKQLHVITALAALLKPGGNMILIEQYPNFRLDWRMEAMTEQGACLAPNDILSLTDAMGGELKLLSNLSCATHYAANFTRV